MFLVLGLVNTVRPTRCFKNVAPNPAQCNCNTRKVRNCLYEMLGTSVGLRRGPSELVHWIAGLNLCWGLDVCP